jgi:AcrR family transcriptional regulator
VADVTSSSRREERRRRHQELSRNQLLDAAEEVFGSKGFHETTLREVAELAEFSVGSVYSFFESKEDLSLQVFLRRGGELIPAMEAAVAGSGSALAQLRALVELQVGFFRQHKHFGRLYLRSSSTTSLPPAALEDDPALLGNFERAMEIQAGVFRHGQATGELRAGDPVVFARLLSGLVSTFQMLDPAVLSDDPEAGLPLEELHAIVAGAFRR